MPTVKRPNAKASTVRILNNHLTDVRLNLEDVKRLVGSPVVDTFVIPRGVSTQDAALWNTYVSTHPDSSLLTSGALMVC
jgi:hypothetical protein